jgi:hypothetical protein
LEHDEDRDQEARIALLQHHTLQMQGYKTHILTIAVVVLTIVEVWLRMPGASRTLPVAVIVSGALAAVVAVGIIFVARVMWFGALVRSAVRAPRIVVNQVDPLISQLDIHITNDARIKTKKEGKELMDAMAKWLARLGEHGKSDRLFCAWLVFALVIFVVVLRLAPVFGLGPEYGPTPDILVEALRWGWPIIVAVVIFILVEWLRKPSLEIQFKDEPATKDARRWVHVFVYNRPRRFIMRSPAAECRSKVTYTNLETGETKGPIETKWASKPGPVSIELGSSGRPVGYSIDERTLALSRIETIPAAAEPKGLDIAVKFDGETDAWIWTPESYYGHKKLEYRLTEGTYKIRVRIESPGIDPVEDEFILENKGDKAAGLKLTPARENPNDATLR